MWTYIHYKINVIIFIFFEREGDIKNEIFNLLDMILFNHPGQYLQDWHFSTDNIESLHNLLRFYITLILKTLLSFCCFLLVRWSTINVYSHLISVLFWISNSFIFSNTGNKKKDTVQRKYKISKPVRSKRLRIASY